MQLLAPSDPAPLLLQQGPGLRLERVAEFEDFQVRRLTLARGVSFSYEVVAHYCLLLVIAGQIELGDTLYGPNRRPCCPQGGVVNWLRCNPRRSWFYYWPRRVSEQLNQGTVCGRILALVKTPNGELSERLYPNNQVVMRDF